MQLATHFHRKQASTMKNSGLTNINSCIIAKPSNFHKNINTGLSKLIILFTTAKETLTLTYNKSIRLAGFF